MPADAAAGADRTVLFYRDFRKFHGGHLKVWDYFVHTRSAPGFAPVIGFSDRTIWGDANPWSEAPDFVADDYDAVAPGAFFVAGRDWHRMDKHPAAGPDVPVINLVQSVRHADPEGTRFEFLGRRAIRICVSEVIADSIRQTGLVAGPLFAIPNGIDVQYLEAGDPADADVDVLIAGLKQPERARELAARLLNAGHTVKAFTDLVPREEFTEAIGLATVTVFLPLPTEGFYLPPMEGMALGTIVICPEHSGERSIYRHGENCFRPPYDDGALFAAVGEALALDEAGRDRIRAAARITAEEHSLDAERGAFLDVLEQVDELWSELAG